MAMHMSPYTPAYREQAREINQELKAQNRILPAILPALLLLAGIALLILASKNVAFPDSSTPAGFGILLFVLFVLWEIREYRKTKRFAANFYGVMLPTVLKQAYAAFAPRTDGPDPLFFDPAENWRLPSTVTFLVLSMHGCSFRAQGIYRIQREYCKSNGLGDKDNDESGQYRVSQDLIWKVRTQKHIPFRLSIHAAPGDVGEAVSDVFGKICDRLMKNGMRDVRTDDGILGRSFRVRANDAGRAERFLDAHRLQLMELRDDMGRFTLEYADDMLTLSFSDFAPIGTKDTGSVRRTGLPNELSAECVEDSAQKLRSLSAWLEWFSCEG